MSAAKSFIVCAKKTLKPSVRDIPAAVGAVTTWPSFGKPCPVAIA
ncbi:hypothetical protein [Paractinoplanes durhamensis]